ncbi:hypothetical protein [Enterovibrio calviensis]|uniref:hypothetical protein n=1 Tax=Enterovibrio calviensis TaxID=91359 RepID=UPI0012DF27BA|nr:hypothetical protein [Enterovibrio calviensis]
MNIPCWARSDNACVPHISGDEAEKCIHLFFAEIFLPDHDIAGGIIPVARHINTRKISAHHCHQDNI